MGMRSSSHISVPSSQKPLMKRVKAVQLTTKIEPDKSFSLVSSFVQKAVFVINWWSRKKSALDGKVKSSKFKARKSWGMRRTYGTSQWRRMQRNAEVGLFEKPSSTIFLRWLITDWSSPSASHATTIPKWAMNHNNSLFGRPNMGENRLVYQVKRHHNNERTREMKRDKYNSAWQALRSALRNKPVCDQKVDLGRISPAPVCPMFHFGF